MPRKVTVIPSAHRLIQSLRDIGYDLPTAVADLIDNSIAAGANEVRIDYEFEGLDTWIRIADNGKGMTPDVLDEALRFGSRREYDDDLELGKFGLGLKTASLSQCSRLTVASRPARASRASIRQWDLDHVKNTDAWELLRLNSRECHPEVTAPLRKSHGTVVFWERLERILGYELPAGKAAQNGFIRLLHELEEHLAMVFHRFLSGEAKRQPKLEIYLNSNKIEAWDPFARKEPKTHATRVHRIAFEHEGVKSSLRVQPYILPHESQFSSMQSFKAAAGPKKWNNQQGFYIYRNDRMLQSGGWNRIRATDEHIKLARIAVDFPPSADTALKINISKMGIIFPPEVRDELTEIVRETARKAEGAYRRKEKGAGGTKSSTRTVPPPAVVTETARKYGTEASIPSSTGGTKPPAGVSESTGSYASEPGWARAGGQNQAGTTDSTSSRTQPSLAQQVIKVLRQVLEQDPRTLQSILRELSPVSDEFRRAAAEREGEPT
ncbi:MAG TPA: ATP-binding protein [Symbiobacteriaceae bacterium]|nr:ATP-binding protein [Symbiobacteriaceae bacterium]